MSIHSYTLADGAAVAPLDEQAIRTVAEQIRTRIAAALARHARQVGGALPTDLKAELTESFLAEQLDAANAEQIAAGHAGLSARAEDLIRARVRDGLLGLGGLQALMDDPGVETINANGCDVVFAIRAAGRSTAEAPIADSDEAMVELIRALARSGEEERRFDRGVARLNAMLPDGSRLFAAMGVAKRPCLSIRKNLLQDASLKELTGRGLMDAKLAAFLAALAGAKFNLLISGGTADGKTTLLRALLGTLPPETRLVTIEDTYELNLDQYPHRHRDVVAYQAREANTEGAGHIPQAELVRWALRMTPDRVIVGELRNDEFIPMCNAMNQGLDGSMATVHASSSEQVVERLINLGLQSPERLPAQATVRLLGSAVDFVIQLGRQRDKTRVITSIREVCGCDGETLTTNHIWRPGPDRRAIRGVQLRPQTLERLIEAGYDPAAWE